MSPNLFAHTGPVGVRLDGLLPVSSAAAGYLYDKADSLEMFVEMRGNWHNEAQRQDALGRIQETRSRLSRHFVLPPALFHLLSPADGDTIHCELNPLLDWEDAFDPEVGDRVRYRVTVSPDSTFESAYGLVIADTSHVYLSDFALNPNQHYWWRVEAFDRGGNCTYCEDNCRTFYLCSYTASVADAQGDPMADSGNTGVSWDRDNGRPAVLPAMYEGDPRLGVRPNPSTGLVRLALYNRSSIESELRAVRRIHVFDLNGRCLRTIESSSDSPFWDGEDDAGRRVPSGVYWVRVTGTAGGEGALSDADDAGGNGNHEDFATARVQIVR